jgi:putative oxidoreductase
MEIIKTIVFWVLLLAFVLPTYYFGYTKLVGQKDKTENFVRWGYSVGFMKLLGLAEIVAGTCLLFSQTRYIGMAIIAIVLIGAVFTHIKNKDEKKEVMTPVFVGVHLLVLFVLSCWLL